MEELDETLARGTCFALRCAQAFLSAVCELTGMPGSLPTRQMQF